MANVKFNNSLLIALAVANIFIAESADRTMHKDAIEIEAYQNGREQGVAIWNLALNKSCYVSRDRRSDRIVVYFGEGICLKGLSDGHYANARYFDTPSEAAEYISSVIWYQD